MSTITKTSKLIYDENRLKGIIETIDSPNPVAKFPVARQESTKLLTVEACSDLFSKSVSTFDYHVSRYISLEEQAKLIYRAIYPEYLLEQHVFQVDRLDMVSQSKVLADITKLGGFHSAKIFANVNGMPGEYNLQAFNLAPAIDPVYNVKYIVTCFVNPA